MANPALVVAVLSPCLITSFPACIYWELWENSNQHNYNHGILGTSNCLRLKMLYDTEKHRGESFNGLKLRTRLILGCLCLPALNGAV